MYFRDFEFLAEPFEIVPDILVPAGAYHSSTIRASYTVGRNAASRATSASRAGDFTTATARISHARPRGADLAPLDRAGDFVQLGRPADGPLHGHAADDPSDLLVHAAHAHGRAHSVRSTSNLLTTNMRFRWEYRPLSELFIVYSDGRDTLTPDSRISSTAA